MGCACTAYVRLQLSPRLPILVAISLSIIVSAVQLLQDVDPAEELAVDPQLWECRPFGEVLEILGDPDKDDERGGYEGFSDYICE